MSQADRCASWWQNLLVASEDVLGHELRLDLIRRDQIEALGKKQFEELVEALGSPSKSPDELNPTVEIGFLADFLTNEWGKIEHYELRDLGEFPGSYLVGEPDGALARLRQYLLYYDALSFVDPFPGILATAWDRSGHRGLRGRARRRFVLRTAIYNQLRLLAELRPLITAGLVRPVPGPAGFRSRGFAAKSLDHVRRGVPEEQAKQILRELRVQLEERVWFWGEVESYWLNKNVTPYWALPILACIERGFSFVPASALDLLALAWIQATIAETKSAGEHINTGLFPEICLAPSLRPLPAEELVALHSDEGVLRSFRRDLSAAMGWQGTRDQLAVFRAWKKEISAAHDRLGVVLARERLVREGWGPLYSFGAGFASAFVTSTDPGLSAGAGFAAMLVHFVLSQLRPVQLTNGATAFRSFRFITQNVDGEIQAIPGQRIGRVTGPGLYADLGSGEEAVLQYVPFVAGKRSRVVHASSCRWVARMDSRRLACFSSLNAALERGFRPCRLCLP